MFRKLFATLALAVFAVAAFAMPKPSDVKAAFNAGNYALAESMLQEVMKERPTAQVHYQLGQVYAKEGKHAEALNEFRQAQALDPSLKFASSAAIFTKNLADEQAIVAPPPTVVVQAQPRAPAYVAPTHVNRDTESSGGGILGVLLGIVVVVGAGIGLFVFLSGRKAKQDALKAETADRLQKNTALLGFTKQLEDAALIAKTATYSDAMKKQIGDRIIALQVSIRGAIGDLKDGREVSSSRMATFESNVNAVVEQATNGLTVTAPTPVPEQVAEVTSEYTPRAEADVYQRPSVAPVPTQTVFHHYSSPSPAPAPVIVNNGGNDLLTGVLIGNMLSGNHDHTVYVERDRPVMDAPRRERDEYVAPAPAKLDTSEDDDRSNSYSSSSSSFDSGSSSSDSYSSSDSSSSFDSGSSSSDSY